MPKKSSHLVIPRRLLLARRPCNVVDEVHHEAPFMNSLHARPWRTQVPCVERSEHREACERFEGKSLDREDGAIDKLHEGGTAAMSPVENERWKRAREQ